jgi:cysteine desulfurase
VATPDAAPGIYLDHHATTPLAPEVFEAMRPWLTTNYGNAASIHHAFGRRAAAAVAESRETLARCLNCLPEEIVFTSGATEANNLAIKGVAAASRGGGQVVTNAAEHRSVLDPIRRLQRRGTTTRILPVDRYGLVSPDAMREALDAHTTLVSVLLANNEVGTINDIGAIAQIAQERGALLHCDAAQAFGRVPIDCVALGADLLSITAHKLYGPQGIGALIVRKQHGRLPLEPLLDGGGHEQGLRSGTLPVALIVGFAAAAGLSCALLAAESERITRLREQLWSGFQRRIDGLKLNGHPERRLPGNLNVTVQSVDGDALLVRLQSSPLAVSSGAACSSAMPEPSHVLRAMGRTDAEARASLRFGIGRGNTADEMEQAAEVVGRIVADLQSGRKRH